MILRILIAVLFAASGVSSVAAQDRLRPVTHGDEISDRYQADIRSAFREAFAGDVRARVVFLPSFALEEAIGLRERNGTYELFALAATQQIWGYSTARMLRSGEEGLTDDDGKNLGPAEAARIDANLPPKPEDLPLQRCAVALDAAPAEAILGAWRVMLDQVQPTDGPELGLDGNTYIFAMPAPGGERSGEAWSPRKGSHVYRLTELATAMRSYCRAPEARGLRTLIALAGRVAP
jgi:hypothetical protein